MAAKPEPVGYLFSQRYLFHNTGMGAGIYPPDGITVEGGEQHFENPATKRRFDSLMESVGLKDECTIIKPVMATDEDLLRVHEPEYIERIRKQSAHLGGDAESPDKMGEGTPFGRGSFEIAKLAAGGTIASLDAIMEGKVRYAYALVRPPGHHAERDHGYGFCLFGNIPVALRRAFERYPGKLNRVAVIDWDVHHGNGTEHAFYKESRVLTISMHQDGLFPPPPSGSAEHRGEGAGEGFNINIPLPPGSGHGIYTHAFDDIVVPAFKAFRPELIVVASGFDAGALDPLGRQMLYSDSYKHFVGRLKELSRGGLDTKPPILFSHEGGYSAVHVPFLGVATMEALLEKSVVTDPWSAVLANWTGQKEYPWQKTIVEELAKGALSALEAGIKREKLFG
ncbi:histone deacetylase superfamily protein [Hyaloraphidium curvatum]|nr:histone deacetylase superfamily protein [Hyaloraphidium curvatum]